MTDESQNTSVIKYVIYFGLTYLAVFTIVSILLSILSTPMTGLFFAITLLGSARVPAYKFLKDNDRLYTNAEMSRLIVGCFIASLIIDLLSIYRMNLNLGFQFILKEIFNLLIIWYVIGPLSKRIYKSSKA